MLLNMLTPLLAVLLMLPLSELTLAILRQVPALKPLLEQGHPLIAELQSFSQADSSDSRAKAGRGLGLNITKALVEGMGGEISFVSQIGQRSSIC